MRSVRRCPAMHSKDERCAKTGVDVLRSARRGAPAVGDGCFPLF